MLELNYLRILGLLAIFGAILYAIGDSLLLAGKASLDRHPKLQPHERLLSGAEKMVELSHQRLQWGGLLGVFATPLILGGFVLVYGGLLPAGVGAALTPFLLFAWATIVGAFVHGSFIYLGEYIQALDKVNTDSQTALLDMFARHRKIMMITYIFLFGCIMLASIWFSVVVGLGGTHFPVWVAAVNPVTTFVVWLVVKKVLPKTIVEQTEGAGFNIAYLFFFLICTVTLWNS